MEEFIQVHKFMEEFIQGSYDNAQACRHVAKAKASARNCMTSERPITAI